MRERRGEGGERKRGKGGREGERKRERKIQTNRGRQTNRDRNRGKVGTKTGRHTGKHPNKQARMDTNDTSDKQHQLCIEEKDKKEARVIEERLID